MPTVLAFRTTPGAVSIPLGSAKTLAVVDVSQFERIRLVADERSGSAGNVVLHLLITEGEETLVALDTITLLPRSQVTKVYEIPGTTLTIAASASGFGTGVASLDVLLYGHAP